MAFAPLGALTNEDGLLANSDEISQTLPSLVLSESSGPTDDEVKEEAFGGVNAPVKGDPANAATATTKVVSLIARECRFAILYSKASFAPRSSPNTVLFVAVKA
mmetsp:Transcript_2946/g.5890  ORF Transcript_2946/g.5890 Transcript_2946/m.5890 type:complete len:104 (-) Transcript_2946:73-384(-)